MYLAHSSNTWLVYVSGIWLCTRHLSDFSLLDIFLYNLAKHNRVGAAWRIGTQACANSLVQKKSFMGNLSFDECARYPAISQLHRMELAQSEPIHH